MAVSGSQKTRIGASISAIGLKLTITAKGVGVIPTVYCLLKAEMKEDWAATKESGFTAELVDDFTAELVDDDFSRSC